MGKYVHMYVATRGETIAKGCCCGIYVNRRAKNFNLFGCRNCRRSIILSINYVPGYVEPHDSRIPGSLRYRIINFLFISTFFALCLCLSVSVSLLICVQKMFEPRYTAAQSIDVF